MQVTKLLRDNHQELLDNEKGESYAVYTKHFNEQLKNLNLLDNLLKDYRGEIILNKSDSWYTYKLTVIYKDIKFSVGKDWKHKLHCHPEELFKLHHIVTHNPKLKQFVNDNKPNNYTFEKLTTKKLIQVLEYNLKLLNVVKVLVQETETGNGDIFNQDIQNLKFIAKHLNTELKHSDDHHAETYFIYTPFGRLHTEYNKHSRRTSHTYEIEKHIEYINKIKENLGGEC